MLYGLGSKRHTLHQFRTKMLQDQLVLEVNGFFPSLTIKEVGNVIVYKTIMVAANCNKVFISSISLTSLHVSARAGRLQVNTIVFLEASYCL
jgi:hypothetical protein